MDNNFSVSLTKVIKELQLDTAYMPGNPDDILITSRDVIRPGLELTGFLDYFDNTRLMLIGNTENAYLNKFSSEQRKHVIDRIFAMKPPAVIVTRGITPYHELMDAAEKHQIPILRTADATSEVSAAIVSYMNAPRITRHGVLVEVYGEGLLIVGDSGVGKSETAIELIKRGHRLIADDAVEIRKVSKKSLVGAAPENIRHFIELRGIGIINARRLFGMGAVNLTENIDMVIMEVAAMNNRQKKMGYNAAQELLASLGLVYDAEPEKKSVDW